MEFKNVIEGEEGQGDGADDEGARECACVSETEFLRGERERESFALSAEEEPKPKGHRDDCEAIRFVFLISSDFDAAIAAALSSLCILDCFCCLRRFAIALIFAMFGDAGLI